MALPRIDTPTYQTQLPSTGETIQFRPFLVKEQKVIMMAEESQDQNSMIQTDTTMEGQIDSLTFSKFKPCPAWQFKPIFEQYSADFLIFSNSL